MILDYKNKFKEDIPYHLLAHGYLLLNIELYKNLNENNLSLDVMRSRFDNLKEKLEKIQIIKPKPIPDDKHKRIEGKESVWNNKNIVMNSMNQFLAIMQNMEQRQQFNKTTCIAIISVIISAIALIIIILCH
jgi:predicted ribonuclease toxin of YeeF-YezG toxin-antitoxin module